MKLTLILLGILLPLALGYTFDGEMNGCECDCICPDTCNTVTPHCHGHSVCDNFKDDASSFSMICAPCLDEILINAMYEDCVEFELEGDAALEEFLDNIAALCFDQMGETPEFPLGVCPTTTPTIGDEICITQATCDAMGSSSETLSSCYFMEMLAMWQVECRLAVEDGDLDSALIEMVDISAWLTSIIQAILNWLKSVLLALRAIIDCILENTCDTSPLIPLLEAIINDIDEMINAIDDLIIQLGETTESAVTTMTAIETRVDCTTTTMEPELVECNCTCLCPPFYVTCTSTTSSTTTTTSTTTTCTPPPICSAFSDTSSEFSELCAPCMDSILINAMIEDCAAFEAAGLIDDFIANIEALCEDQTGDKPNFYPEC